MRLPNNWCEGILLQWWLPPRIYSHFPLLPPISSLSASSSSYHPYTACPGETAVEDIMLCCGDPWESKTKGGKWGVKGETVKDGKGRSSRGNAGVLAIYIFLYIFFATSFPRVFAPYSYQYSVQNKLLLFKSIFLWLVAATTILCTIFTAICNLTFHNMCSSQLVHTNTHSHKCYPNGPRLTN